MFYLLNIIIYGVFVGLIFGLKRNTKKRLPVCIVIPFVSIVMQLITDFIIGCLLSAFYDVTIAIVVITYFYAVASIVFVTMTVWIISLVAGCSIRDKFVLIASIMLFVISMLIQYADVKLVFELQEVIENVVTSVYINEFVEADKLNREISVVETVRNTVDRLPAIIYIVAVFIKKKK